MENRKEVISNHSFNFRKLARSRSGYLKLSTLIEGERTSFLRLLSLTIVHYSLFVIIRREKKIRARFCWATS